ncbi:hypothetical protein IIV6-T1_088 [Invertebrate iridescent virus 6]|nr:hypothetical protein IIV6-T1_088 [Invertebrate iridescent virus 6]
MAKVIKINLIVNKRMSPAIILIGVLILIVLFVIKFNSSEVSSILTSAVTSEGDDEHETETRETTGCISQLNTLRATLAAKKKELKTLRTARKKECTEQLAKTQAEVDRIQAKIDNFSSRTKIVPLPGGEVGPPYNPPPPRTNTRPNQRPNPRPAQLPQLYNYDYY